MDSMGTRTPVPPSVANPATSLRELATLFLRMGTTAFGGPAAHIALLEDEVVRRRQWMTRERFLDYVSAANLIPGPNSTELVLHIGRARGGWPGLFVAGVCFIAPAMFIIAVVAWAYVRYGSLPDAAGLLYGIKPVVMSIVAMALWSLGLAAMKTAPLAIVGALAGLLVASGAHELVVLAGAGAVMGIARISRSGAPGPPALTIVAALSAPAAAAAGMHATAGVAPFALPQLFLVFAKAGAVLFGSGYVLLAFLRADLVERLRWLTEPQLLDAIAIGQVMPGPLFTTATFIGFVLGGPSGAIVATVGIFLPAFVFVAISGPIVPRLRQSVAAAAVLDGVNVASFALMAVVSWQLGRAAFIDMWTVALALVSLIVLVRFRVNSAWLIALGGVFGWLVRQ